MSTSVTIDFFPSRSWERRGAEIRRSARGRHRRHHSKGWDDRLEGAAGPVRPDRCGDIWSTPATRAPLLCDRGPVGVAARVNVRTRCLKAREGDLPDSFRKIDDEKSSKSETVRPEAIREVAGARFSWVTTWFSAL